MAAFRAARMEKKIVKIPKNKVVIALGSSEAAVAGNIRLEKDLAIHQQGEKFSPGKTGLPAELFDLMGFSKYRHGGRNFRIANLEQRAGARRFQHHVVAAPPHVREPRQDENVGIVDWRRLRPVI